MEDKWRMLTDKKGKGKKLMKTNWKKSFMNKKEAAQKEWNY